jgi:uncharacterized membrane protein
MRVRYLDYLRGIAVLWMVIFHTAYDMRTFGMNQWDFGNGFWYAFPRLIAGTFLFCVGVSLNFTHAKGVNYPALRDRLFKVGGCALIISLVTYFAFPTQWIYFGTLHCILCGSLLGAFFVHQRALAWALMSLLLILQYATPYDIQWVSSIIRKPSMDFIPIYPWFWVVLAGIVLGPFMGQIKVLQKLPDSRFLNFLGQHSLKIYLIHQPVIFGTLWVIQFLIRK